MHDLTRHARRATVGTSALSGLSGVFLICSIAFWGVLHWQVMVTPGGGLPQIIVAIVMTLIYSLALPVLLSTLVPTTPAGQLLQKTQWRTVGFPVIVASVAFLFWHAYTLMLSWFSAQPSIAEADLARPYTISALIAFVVIVALAWTQTTPERWLREIEQAHQVKKLELMQRGELAIVKARLLWAEQKAAVSYAKLLPAEQQEVRDTLKGLLMGIADTQRSIARTMGLQGEIERSIMGDTEIADSLDYVARQLEKPAQSLDQALTWIHDEGRETWLADAEKIKVAHVDSRLQSSESREALNDTYRQVSIDNDAYRRAARHELGLTPWTIKRLAETLAMSETSARNLRDEWLTAGVVRESRLGRWCFTE